MKPRRDPKYLVFIRSFPCVVCGSTFRIEAAHTGPRGLSQKSPDRSAIPLCARHHRTGADSYHTLGRRKFEERHSLDIEKIVSRLNRKPRLTIEDGTFVAEIDGEQFVLRPAGDGLQKAVQRALSICRETRVVAS